MPAHSLGLYRFLMAVLAVGLLAWPVAGVSAEGPSPGEVESTLPQTEPFPERSDDLPAVDEPRRAPREVPEGGRPVAIERFEISGNRVVSDEELQSVVRPYVGEQLTLSEIYAIADEISSYYQSQGYGLASATIPAQRVDGGVVRIEVIEGRVGEIRFEGLTDYEAEFLRAQLDGVAAGKVYRSRAIERELLLLNDLPGLSSRVVVTPGQEYGTSDLVFRNEEDPRSFLVGLDNFGRESIGEWRLTGDGTFNNLSGRGDRLNLGFVYGQSGLLKYYKAAYGMPVGTDGGRIRLSANRADYDVDTSTLATNLAVFGDSTNIRLDYTRPVLRSRKANRYLGLALQRTDAESFTGNLLATQTDLTFLEINYLMNFVGSGNSVNTLTAAFSTNFQDFETDSTGGRASGEDQKGKLKVDFSRSAPIVGDWSYLLRGSAQYSMDPLVDTQQFSLGGANNVRAYGPSEARGDHGVFASFEVQYLSELGGTPAVWSLFADGGRVIQEESAISDLDRTSGIAGVGVGFEYNPGGRHNLRAQFAYPVGGHQAVDGDDSGHLWVTYVSRF